MAEKEGIEPSTYRLTAGYSTSELPLSIKDFIRNLAADFTPLASHTIRESSISTCP